MSPFEETRQLHRALTDLVRKLRLIESTPVYRAVWESAWVHGVRYDGPTYETELLAAEHLLNPPPPAKKPDAQPIETEGEVR